MKKLKLMKTLIAMPVVLGVVPTFVCTTSCSGNKIDTSGVEHGTVEISEVKLNENFTIKFTPEDSWIYDNNETIIYIGNKKYDKDNHTDVWGYDPVAGTNSALITVYGPKVDSTNIKIVIKPTQDVTALTYDHLLEETKEYFEWEKSLNPKLVSKSTRSATIKIKKIKDYGEKILNPKVISQTAVSVTPSEGVSLADMQVNETKEMTFTWNASTTTIGFAVKIDYIPVFTKKTTSWPDEFVFVNLPDNQGESIKINKVDKKMDIVCQFKDLSHVSGGNPFLECRFNDGALETQKIYLDKTTTEEQTNWLEWNSDLVNKIEVIFKINE